MATTTINTPLLPIDRVPSKSDTVLQTDRPDVPDMPVFSGGRQKKVEHSRIAGSQSGSRTSERSPELGENDPEARRVSDKENLSTLLSLLSETELCTAYGFPDFFNYQVRDTADYIGKFRACDELNMLYKSNLSLEDKLARASAILEEWAIRYLPRNDPSFNSETTSVSTNLNQLNTELDKLNDSLKKDTNSSDSNKVSVLTQKNLKDLGLEDDRVRPDQLSIKSEGARTTCDDAFWTLVDPCSNKSRAAKNDKQKNNKSPRDDGNVQSTVWSDSIKSEVQKILELLPPQNEEQKNLAQKLLRRMKFGVADRLLKSYLSLYSRDGIFPELTDALAEELNLLVEDILPGYQSSSPAYQHLYEGCLPVIPLPSPRVSTTAHRSKRTGNSGKKFEAYRLNQSVANADNAIELPPVGGDNRELEAKQEPQETTDEMPKLEETDSVHADSEAPKSLEDLIHASDPFNLPRYMKFRKGDKVVIATLHENDDRPVSDHSIKAQTHTYLLEPYTLYKSKMIPWHDLDPDFPSRPFEINAAQLVDLAGRRWAGREDLEQKRALLASGYECCYHMGYVDKLNLTRDNLIKVLDIVLGDKTRGKVFEPEPIPCVNSTYQSDKPAPHAKIWVRRNFERTQRAYTLLNLNVDHYIFPFTTDELRKGIIKRTSNHQNRAAWIKNYRTIVNVCQSFMFDKESLPDVQPGDFLNFAREMISRKGLSDGESMPLFAAAKYAEFLLENDGSNERLLSMLTYCLEKETKVFVKDEEYEKTDTTHRFIVSPHAFVKVVFGTVFRPVEEKLYFDDRSPLKKHLIKGKSQEEVKELLTSMPRKEGEVYCEVDAKAFESSQNENTLKWEYRIYKSFYSQTSLACAIISRVQRSNCHSGWLYNKNFRILRNAMRLSGLNTTACGNALWNYINLVAVCGVDPDAVFYIEGDDGILVLPVSVALHMTEISLFPLTFLMAEEWSQLSFCGHHYDADGQRLIPREALVRKLCTYFSCNPINRRKAYELLYLRLLSFQLSYPGNPYLDELIDEVNREYADVRSAGVRDKTVRQWYKENWWRFDNHVGEIVLPSDRTIVPSFHKLYDAILTKIDQSGEVLTPKKKVSVVNYCLSEGYSSKASNAGNFVLSLIEAGSKLVRRLSGHRNRAPENSLVKRPLPPHDSADYKELRRARAHDAHIDYLNQFGWFRRLSKATNWSLLKYSGRAAIGPVVEYFPDADFELVLCTRAFNHEWKKLMRLDELAINGPLGPGRANGVRAL